MPTGDVLESSIKKEDKEADWIKGENRQSSNLFVADSEVEVSSFAPGGGLTRDQIACCTSFEICRWFGSIRVEWALWDYWSWIIALLALIVTL